MGTKPITSTVNLLAFFGFQIHYCPRNTLIPARTFTVWRDERQKASGFGVPFKTVLAFLSFSEPKRKTGRVSLQSAPIVRSIPTRAEQLRRRSGQDFGQAKFRQLFELDMYSPPMQE
jgi:hypothetical protein